MPGGVPVDVTTFSATAAAGNATALKLRGLEYARQQSVARVWTDNESSNTAILSINDGLGFVRESALLSLVLRGAERPGPGSG